MVAIVNRLQGEASLKRYYLKKDVKEKKRWTFFFVQSLSCIWLFATPWTAAHQAPLSSTISQSLLRFMSIESLMLSVLSSATLFFHLQSSPASESYIRWPKYWSFSFSISPSKEYSGLISFRIDWFDLLAAAAQGTLKEFPSTTIQKHQFFDTQPSLWSNSHPCITTRKTIALTIRTFVGQVMSSLFNILYLWTRPQ